MLRSALNGFKVRTRGRLPRWTVARFAALAATCAALAFAGQARSQTDSNSTVASATDTSAEPNTSAPSRPRPPWEFRSGVADLVLQPVEQDVSPDEVTRTVRALLAQSQICVSWPSLWIEPGSIRRDYIVRFDLMARDWGAASAADGQQRMDEFVDMGFMTKQARSDIGAGVFEYTVTPQGVVAMNGTPGQGRTVFCGRSERRLVEITRLEWGSFGCGNLRAHFTYTSDGWPAWATTDAARARIAADVTPAGAIMHGTVSLRRVWQRRASYQPRDNGALQSACYDPEQSRRVADDDLSLDVSEP